MAAIPTPRQAYEAHVAALDAGDLDAVVAGYSDDAVLASTAGIGQGRGYVRTVFASFLSSGAELSPVSTVHEQDDVVFVTWTARTDDGELAGADTFVVREGLIRVHSGFFTRAHL